MLGANLPDLVTLLPQSPAQSQLQGELALTRARADDTENGHIDGFTMRWVAQQIQHLGGAHRRRLDRQPLCLGPRMEIAVFEVRHWQEAEDVQPASQRRLD